MILVENITVLPLTDAPALVFAGEALEKMGVCVAKKWSRQVTHVLLPVPTKDVDLGELPENVTVIGGNLDPMDRRKTIDLLRQEEYLAENAALTADCALRLLGQHLPTAFRDCPVLIIGWGRIGKCLAAMLKGLDMAVSVAARKPSDLGMLTALGYTGVEIGRIDPEKYRAILNTAPAPVLDFGGNAVKIDLASRPGIAGEDVLWARGLPGKMLPEASGALIARGVLREIGGDQV